MGLRGKFGSWLGSANGSATAAPDFEERGVDTAGFVGPAGMPSRPVAAPQPAKDVQQDSGIRVDESVRGVPGTPNLAGFVEDIGEYDPRLMGLSGIKVYEKMRRSDPICAALELARTLPIRSADWQIVEGVDASAPGRGLAKEMAALARENFFGGLERTTASGEKKTQTLESVIENALLCILGVSGHEDIWEVDADKGKVRLARMAPRLPDTFYQFVTEPDGETLYELIQFGFRGAEVLLLPVKATKLALFIMNREGANFYGRSIFRPCYTPWYFKQHLMRIEAVALERNGMGIPHINLGPNASPDDKSAAWQYASNLSANERTALVTPNGFTAEILAVKGKVLSPRVAIEYYDKQMLNSGLAAWLLLGQGTTGTRAVGSVQKDFYLLAEEALAGMIAETISSTSLRRLCDHNFEAKPGERLPYPKLVCADIRMVELETVLNAVKELAQANVGILETTVERDNAVAEMLGLPKIGAETRPKFAPIVRQIREMEQGADEAIPNEGAPKEAESTPKGGEKRDQVEVEKRPKATGNRQQATGNRSQATGDRQQEKMSEAKGDLKPNRELKAFEKKHDFAGHAKRADIAARQVARVLRHAKPAAIHEAARLASGLQVSQLGELRLPFDRTLAMRINLLLKAARDYGHAQVYAERKRATKLGKNEKPGSFASLRMTSLGDSPKRDSYFIAEASLSDFQNWLTARTRGAAVDAVKAGAEGEELEKQIEQNLLEGSDGQIDRIGDEAGRAAVAAGRADALEELEPEIELYIRSEAMDGNTCDPCIAGDGREWKSFDEINWTPGDDCEGGDACRGQVIPVFEGEGTVVLE